MSSHTSSLLTDSLDVEKAEEKRQFLPMDLKRKISSARWMLSLFACILLIVLLVTLGVIVAMIYTKTEMLSQSYQRAGQAAHRIMDNGKLLDIPITELGANSITGQGRSNADNKKNGIHPRHTAVQLTASKSLQSLSKGQENSYIVDFWEMQETSNREDFKVLDERELEVQRDGVYLIYAQLGWRKKSGMTRFSIQKSGEDAASSVLTQCTSHFPDSYAALKTCYSSVVVKLQKKDRMVVAVQRDDLTLDFQSGKSFFGALLLS